MFESVELTWRDRKFVIPPERVLRAIARVEEVITLQQLTTNSMNIGMSRLAMAYGSLLRYAGAKVSDDEVYVELFTNAGAEATVVVTALLMVMIPKAVTKRIAEMQEKVQAGGEAPAEGKADAPTAGAS